jgi:histidine triad (HIT) family protein
MTMSGEDCIFCKIASGELPATIVYQDERLVAFEDINPVAPVHLLIVPRKHYATLNEVDDPALLGHMMTTAARLADDLGVAQRGYRALINCQRDGGQVVFHLHLHLIGGRKLGTMA